MCEWSWRGEVKNDCSEQICEIIHPQQPLQTGLGSGLSGATPSKVASGKKGKGGGGGTTTSAPQSSVDTYGVPRQWRHDPQREAKCIGEIVVELLRKPRPPPAQAGGQAPLHAAAANGHVGSCRTLVNAGANMEMLDNANCTPLRCSIRNGHIHVAKYLLDVGADPAVVERADICMLQETDNVALKKEILCLVNQHREKCGMASLKQR